MTADLIIRSNCIMPCKDKDEPNSGKNRGADIIDGYIAVSGGRILAVGEGNVPEGYLKEETFFIDAR